MSTKEIREMSQAEIEKEIRDTRDSRLDLRMRKQTGKLNTRMNQGNAPQNSV